MWSNQNLLSAGEDIKLYKHFRKHAGHFFYTVKCTLYDQAIPLLGIYPIG